MLAVLALSGGAAGCGKGSGAPASSPGRAAAPSTGATVAPPSPPPARPACRLVSAAAVRTSVRSVLGAAAAGRGRPRAKPGNDLALCDYRTGRVRVIAQIDTGSAAPARRCTNRLEERQQFFGPDPRGHPVDVSHVGRVGQCGALGAYFVASLGELIGVRGDRYITIDVLAPRASDAQVRRIAVSVGRKLMLAR